MQVKQSSAWLEAKKERKGKAKRNNRGKSEFWRVADWINVIESVQKK